MPADLCVECFKRRYGLTNGKCVDCATKLEVVDCKNTHQEQSKTQRKIYVVPKEEVAV